MSSSDSQTRVVVQSINGRTLVDVELGRSATVADLLQQLLGEGHYRVCTLLIDERQLDPCVPIERYGLLACATNYATAVFWSADGLKQIGLDARKLVRDKRQSLVTALCCGQQRVDYNLKPGGYSVRELKETGFSSKELKTCCCALSDLLAAGFTAEECKKAGYDALEFHVVGFTIQHLQEMGFSVSELLELHKECQGALVDLLDAGFTIAQCKEIGYDDVRQFHRAGCTLSELEAAGFALQPLCYAPRSWQSR